MTRVCTSLVRRKGTLGMCRDSDGTCAVTTRDEMHGEGPGTGQEVMLREKRQGEECK